MRIDIVRHLPRHVLMRCNMGVVGRAPSKCFCKCKHLESTRFLPGISIRMWMIVPYGGRAGNGHDGTGHYWDAVAAAKAVSTEPAKSDLLFASGATIGSSECS